MLSVHVKQDLFAHVHKFNMRGFVTYALQMHKKGLIASMLRKKQNIFKEKNYEDFTNE